MSQFGASNSALIPSQLAALVTDPDLAAAQSALVTAFESAIAPKASQLSVDNIGATLGPAITLATADKATSAELVAATATITTAIAANGLMAREVRTFPANAVPSNFSAVEGTQYVPVGGIVTDSVASSTGAGTGDMVYMSEGSGAGLWRFKGGTLQRFDISLNASVGSAYTVPGYYTAGYLIPAMTTVGTRIYMANLQFASNSASARAFMFDTANPGFTEVAALPRALTLNGGAGRAIRLLDGRILITASAAVGLTITPAETPFWIYDPVADVTPLERIVALPITKFMDGYIGAGMQRMPSGAMLLVDVAQPAVGNALSCLLTVTGTSIGVSAAADTLVNASSSSVLIPTATGALFGYGTLMRAYTEGAGWVATGARPWAYPATTGSAMRSRVIPGIGVALVGSLNTGGGQITVSIWFTGAPSMGSTLVAAIKNT